MKIYEPYFDPIEHVYHDPAGMRLEGTTDILQGELHSYNGYPASVSVRGKDVHTACQFLDEDDLVWETLTPEIRAYVECYAAAKKFYGITVLQNEVMRYHPKYFYAGCVDKPSIIEAKKGILDLKSGLKEIWHKWQVALYWALLLKEIPDLTMLWTLYIKPGEYLNGRGFDLVTYENPQRLFNEALALFSAYQIKKNNGYVKEKRRIL